MADAIRGPAGALSDGDATAIAELLRLADDSSLRSALAIGLRKAFLDREPVGRAVEFSSVYSHLALPCLFGTAREQALALLGEIASLS